MPNQAELLHPPVIPVDSADTQKPQPAEKQKGKEKPAPPSGRLMWHIAHGNFEQESFDPTQPASKVSEQSSQALYARHEAQRKTDSDLRQQTIRKQLEGKFTQEEIAKRLYHEEMKKWSNQVEQQIGHMLVEKNPNTIAALQKIGFDIEDDALKNKVYTPTSDTTGDYGPFYEKYCRRGKDMNKLLAEDLTPEEMDAVKPFLQNILGSEDAFLALRALRETKDFVENQHLHATPTAQTTKYSTEKSFIGQDEKVFTYFKKGAEMINTHPEKIAQQPDTPSPTSPSSQETNPSFPKILTPTEQLAKDEVEEKVKEELNKLKHEELKYNGISQSALQNEAQKLGLDPYTVGILLTQYPDLLEDIPQSEFTIERRKKIYKLLLGEDVDPQTTDEVKRRRAGINRAIAQVVTRTIEQQFITEYEKGQLPYASMKDALQASFDNFKAATGEDALGGHVIDTLKQHVVMVGNRSIRADIGAELLTQLMNDLSIKASEMKQPSSPTHRQARDEYGNIAGAMKSLMGDGIRENMLRKAGEYVDRIEAKRAGKPKPEDKKFSLNELLNSYATTAGLPYHHLYNIRSSNWLSPKLIDLPPNQQLQRITSILTNINTAVEQEPDALFVRKVHFSMEPEALQQAFGIADLYVVATKKEVPNKRGGGTHTIIERSLNRQVSPADLQKINNKLAALGWHAVSMTEHGDDIMFNLEKEGQSRQQGQINHTQVDASARVDTSSTPEWKVEDLPAKLPPPGTLLRNITINGKEYDLFIGGSEKLHFTSNGTTKTEDVIFIHDKTINAVRILNKSNLQQMINASQDKEKNAVRAEKLVAIPSERPWRDIEKKYAVGSKVTDEKGSFTVYGYGYRLNQQQLEPCAFGRYKLNQTGMPYDTAIPLSQLSI